MRTFQLAPFGENGHLPTIQHTIRMIPARYPGSSVCLIEPPSERPDGKRRISLPHLHGSANTFSSIAQAKLVSYAFHFPQRTVQYPHRLPPQTTNGK